MGKHNRKKLRAGVSDRSRQLTRCIVITTTIAITTLLFVPSYSLAQVNQWTHLCRQHRGGFSPTQEVHPCDEDNSFCVFDLFSGDPWCPASDPDACVNTWGVRNCTSGEIATCKFLEDDDSLCDESCVTAFAYCSDGRSKQCSAPLAEADPGNVSTDDRHIARCDHGTGAQAFLSCI